MYLVYPHRIQRATPQVAAIPQNICLQWSMGTGPNPFAVACGRDVADAIMVTLKAPSCPRRSL